MCSPYKHVGSLVTMELVVMKSMETLILLLIILCWKWNLVLLLNTYQFQQLNQFSFCSAFVLLKEGKSCSMISNFFLIAIV